MKKELISLKEHNTKKRDFYFNKLNGIACPECGKELVDTNPNFTLDSFPPKKAVHCPHCSWSGTRIA